MDGHRVSRLRDLRIRHTRASFGSGHSSSSNNSHSEKMEQLSGVMIIIIIGSGVLTFVMLFIFAKRQIMRFTLRSRRGPHVPVGNDAKKTVRREIERRLDCIQKIVQEPKLLWTDDKYIVQPEQPLPAYHYRMQAVDDVKILEREISRSDGSTRHAYDSLRAFLLTTLSAVLNGAGQRMIHQFCDMYEHARHDPNEFGSDEYEAYHRLLMKLIDAAKQLKTFANSRKTSPARTPKKQTKMHSLLDPGRLRPPPLPTAGRVIGGGGGIMDLPPSSELTAGQQSKVNLTLGLGRPMHEELMPIGGGGLATANDPIHLQPAAERDAIIRNRIKTPTLDDVPAVEVLGHVGAGGAVIEGEADDQRRQHNDEDILSISTAKFACSGGASVV